MHIRMGDGAGNEQRRAETSDAKLLGLAGYRHIERLAAQIDSAFTLDGNLIGIDSELLSLEDAVPGIKVSDRTTQAGIALVVCEDQSETVQHIDAGQLCKRFANLAAWDHKGNRAVRVRRRLVNAVADTVQLRARTALESEGSARTLEDYDVSRGPAS